MSTVSETYSLIVSAKVGNTGKKDSGFVQRLKGTVTTTSVKAAAPAQLMAKYHFKVQRPTSQPWELKQREVGNYCQQCNRIFLK